MTKGRSKLNWKKQVLEWQSSGKSCRVWCRENKIPSSTFYGWKNRFEKSDNEIISPETKPEFIELKDSSTPESGITVEYGSIQIHLKPNFDQATFKQCLACLRGTSC